MDLRNLPEEENKELSDIIQELSKNRLDRKYTFIKYTSGEIKDIDPDSFFSIIDAIAHPALVTDPFTGDIIHANPAARYFCGYTSEEFSRLNLHQINQFSPDLQKKIEQEANINKRNYLLAPHKLKSGDIRLVDIFINYVFLNGKRYNFFFINDATEALLSKQDALEQLNEIKTIMNAIPDTVIFFDKSGYIRYFKPSQNSPYSDISFIGKDIRDVGFPERDLNFLLNLIDKTLKTKESITEDYIRENQNENTHYVVVAVPLGDEQVITISRDITERMRWLEKENRYNLILDNMYDAVIVFDIESEKYVDCNETACRIFGYTKEELLQLKREDLVAEPERLRPYKYQDHVDIPNIQFRCKNGEIRYCDEKAFKSELNNRQVMIVIVNDVTELVIISEELKNYTSAIRNSGSFI
jgi:PAS domain S-box-containing protein